MKEKALIGIVFATLIIASTFAALTTTKAAFKGTITVGIIGPYGLPHWDPAGMKPAAEMAQDEINAAGGIALSDGNYEVVLKFGNEYAYPTPDPAAAASEVERLITVEGCQYLIGGFRTECTTTMIEKAMDYKIPFIINGAATNELMSLTVNQSDPVKYSRYKYLFRVNPTNGTALLYTIAGAAQYIIGTRLLPLYGHVLYSNVTQVKVAVVMEDLAWTSLMYYYLTTPAIYPMFLGKYANVTYKGRIPDGTADCTSWLQGVKDSGARLLIHIFSGVTGDPFISQWKSMNVSAMPLGINVMGQLQQHWNVTGGKCQYETFTNYMGTRTPIVPGVTEAFWDKFVAKTGVWPIYTGSGAYNSLYLLKNGLEGSSTSGKPIDNDALVTYYENPSLVMSVAAGNGYYFKFDSTHDVYCPESSPTWTRGFVRSFIVQWQVGRMEVVALSNGTTPFPWVKKWALPISMKAFVEDVSYDGKINILDMSAAAIAFQTQPGDARWDIESDVNTDGKVNILDLAKIALKWGQSVSLPLP